MCCFKKRKSDKVPENPNIPSTKTTQNPCASVDVNEDVGGGKIYRGWVNLLNERYNPRTFHVNMLETVTVRLQGHMLHIEHHEKAVLRHAFYEDPTLTETEPEIIKEDVYDVSDAKIKLRPCHLSKRRWFSRKYPIKIELAFDPQHASKDRGYLENNTEGIGSDSEDDIDYTLTSSESEDVLSTSKHSLKRKSSRVVWLFARSSREKENWFHRLRIASKEYLYPIDNEKGQAIAQMPSIDNLMKSREFYVYMLQDVEFRNQLDSIMNEAVIRSDKQCAKTIFMDLGRYKRTRPSTETGAEFIAVINLIVSRIAYDFVRDEHWLGLVRKKIKTKLGAVHLPCFVETLKLVKFELGTSIPNILKVYRPIVDQWGIWMDFDMKYDGSVQLTIETQVDLKRLTDQNESFDEPDPGKASYFGVPVKNAALAVPDTRYSDEEVPLSPEDEPDENFGAKMRGKERIKPGRKMQTVDKITQSDKFKGATEMNIVRKALEEISETRMLLNVEISQLEGRMTANVAHPPSDRLWYGFRETPKIAIKATPQIGDKTIAFSILSDWIEGKVVNLIEKFLVYPNLDDLVIALLSGNELLKGNFTE